MSTDALTRQARKTNVPHETRTSAEPRQNSLHPVRLSYIKQVNSTIRLLRFTIPSQSDNENLNASRSSAPIPSIPFSFLPGQWLDVHIPSLHDAGGFTITSTPREASEGSSSPPYIELAVQDSPSNPAAAWLWRPESEILGAEVRVRVGGSFVWPPSAVEGGIPLAEIRNVVFVAGGVGINPLMSMISHIHQTRSDLHPSTNIYLLYTTRLPSAAATLPSPSRTLEIHNILNQILFLPRLREIVRSERKQHQQQKDTNLVFKPLDVRLYLTNLSSHPDTSADELAVELHDEVAIYDGRITVADLEDLIGSDRDEQARTVCNLCGPPRMTDDFVEILERILGNRRVFYEKWW
ncbi:hypothetical protein PRK78_003121 [Emydomyces testavorans]|uniref:FAD-binding FR-type domain-containing protein n=1 Tax=Emydomyces testavorans TaxID=2070801 RepID=A0AAF0DFH4_9EURO|nr:hypothetical protein PRK78_003121 [Emydomyces testavorans]